MIHTTYTNPCEVKARFIVPVADPECPILEQPYAEIRMAGDGNAVTLYVDADADGLDFLRALKNLLPDIIRQMEGHLCPQCESAKPSGVAPWAALCKGCGEAKSAEWKAVAESVQDEPGCRCQGCRP